jgi:hypothetical protein
VLLWIRLFHPPNEGTCSGVDIIKGRTASLFNRMVVVFSRTVRVLFNESNVGTLVPRFFQLFYEELCRVVDFFAAVPLDCAAALRFCTLEVPEPISANVTLGGPNPESLNSSMKVRVASGMFLGGRLPPCSPDMTLLRPSRL